MTRFLQIHTLTSYPASLLNRDDVGFAKRVPFGDAVRTRISSQCLKRHWRTFEGDAGWHGITDAQMSVRSRLSFEKYLRKPLVDQGVADEVAVAVTSGLMELVLGKSQAKKAAATAASDEVSESHRTAIESAQVTVLGRKELDYLLGEAASIARGLADQSGKKLASAADKAVKERAKDKDWKKNLRELQRAAGLDAALFGRMVTSDLLAAGDAALHVAHAFTVHEQKSESDYFSAVDDIVAEQGEAGSGHINSSELTSGVYYGYVAVDVPLLVSNLEGCAVEEWQDADHSLARTVIERLIRLVSTVSPGAKRGSTAPYAYAHFVGLEAGAAQPRTFANAFSAAVARGADPIARAYEQLANHVAELDSAYGAVKQRSSLHIGEGADAMAEAFGASRDLNYLSAWAAETGTKV